MTAAQPLPGLSRRRFFATLGGALAFSALPEDLFARDLRNYWPASREEQHQITLWCPPKIQAWLKKLDDLTARHFLSLIVNEGVPVENIVSMNPDLSARQLKDVRQRCMAFVRHLPERPLTRQQAQDRSWELAQYFSSTGYHIVDAKRARAEKPGIHAFEIPVNRGLDYAIVIATDALNEMGVPFKLTAENGDLPGKPIAWDHRALAQGLCSIHWTSGFNGNVLLTIEFLASSVFDQGLACGWHAVLGRRAGAENLNSERQAFIQVMPRPPGS